MAFIRKGRRSAAIATIVVLVGAAGAATSVLANGVGKGEGNVGASLKAWGSDADGQLGDGAPVTSESRSPVAVSAITCATSVAVSDLDSFAVLGSGTVEAWGADEDNRSGSFGDEGKYSPYSTTPVTVPGITTAVSVTADTPDVFVLLANGTIVGWGNDERTEFGNGFDASGGSNVPVAIGKGLSGVKALAAEANAATLALLDDGEVDSWEDELASPNETDALGREVFGKESTEQEPRPV
ncbi:MAG TPA: hypothetical protein VMB05_03510, partial [Solirubrobacteraceae bacterium]|nr:hypothetical protein [Solirubrobacteraceae bacterium]